MHTTLTVWIKGCTYIHVQYPQLKLVKSSSFSYNDKRGLYTMGYSCLSCFSLHLSYTFKACPPLFLRSFNSTRFQTIIQHQCLKKKKTMVDFYIMVENWLTDQLSGQVDDLVFIMTLQLQHHHTTVKCLQSTKEGVV